MLASLRGDAGAMSGRMLIYNNSIGSYGVNFLPVEAASSS